MPSRSAPATTISGMRRTVLRVTKRFGVTNVRLFGSFARGEQRRSSDIDLLVDVPCTMTLFSLASLRRTLEERLGRKVDVIPARSLKPALKESILSEARPL